MLTAPGIHPSGSGGEGGGPTGLWTLSAPLLRTSLALAFLSLVLLPLNAFPHGLIDGLYPERPAYLVSLLGLACYAVSLDWLSRIRENVPLLLLVGAFLLYGLLVTCAGLVRLEEQGLAPYVLFQYLKRKVIPTLYILWFAFLLSSLPERSARRFFIAALLAMFLPNAAHMFLEMLANAGCSGVREFLIDINPWFRQVNTSHGVWPPPYFTDRVRGLFAEPSHLAYALTPLLAFFLYKLRSNALYALPVLFVGCAFAGATPTLTGVISLGFLLCAFFADMVRARFGKRAACLAVACVFVACAVTLAMLYGQGDGFAKMDAELHTIGEIANYCKAARHDVALLPPPIDGVPFSRLFTRLACLRIESDIALQYPWGTGFFLGGFYWKPLLAWSSAPVELFVWVRDAFASPVPVIPHLCEYTALASEMGFPGLFLFLLLCAHIAVRAYKRYCQEKDAFVLYMIFALCASLLTLVAFALKSGFMLYYFLGFLYALGRNSQSRPSASDGSTL